MLGATRRLLCRGRAGVLVDITLVRFATIGLMTTVLDLVVFSLLAVGVGLFPVAANVISYSFGIATSFVLNRSWTFSVPRGARGVERQALRFLASNLAALLFSSLLVALFILVLPEMTAKLVSVPIVFLWNYAVARLWVFR